MAGGLMYDDRKDGERGGRGEERPFVEHQSALWRTGGHTCAGEALTLAVRGTGGGGGGGGGSWFSG